jgi:hypothetical protein
MIPPDDLEHDSAHTHEIGKPFHYCTTTFVMHMFGLQSLTWLE